MPITHADDPTPQLSAEDKALRQARIAKLLVQSHGQVKKQSLEVNKDHRNWAEKNFLGDQTHHVHARRKDSIVEILTEKLEQESTDSLDPEDVMKEVNGEISSKDVATLFEHLFVSPETYGNEGDGVAADFYKRKTLVSTVKTTEQAPSRREIPVATFVRNSTHLTRAYLTLGHRLAPIDVMRSHARRMKIVGIADEFNAFKEADKKSRVKKIKHRKRIDSELNQVLQRVEYETFSFSRGERSIAFPRDYAFPYIGLSTQKKRRKRKKRQKKGSKGFGIDLSDNYKLQHATSRKALKALQQELLNTLMTEKYGKQAYASTEEQYLNRIQGIGAAGKRDEIAVEADKDGENNSLGGKKEVAGTQESK